MPTHQFPTQLIDGYHSFLEHRFSDERIRYEDLAQEGQTPEIMVIGCCDSRVAPEVVFDAKPGELFVVRNVANIVPECETNHRSYHGTSAALEYAVLSLNVKHIIVLGHALCGGIKAFAQQTSQLSAGDFIGKWVSQIAPAAQRLPKDCQDHPDYLRTLELAVVRNSLDNLMTFPYVADKVKANKLMLHGAYFGVATGNLLVFDQESESFVSLAGKNQTPPWARALSRQD